MVYKLTPTVHGPWKETVLHTFTGGSDGSLPFAGVILDSREMSMALRPSGAMWATVSSSSSLPPTKVRGLKRSFIALREAPMATHHMAA